METLRLIKPCVELQDEYMEMLEEWNQTGEKKVPFVLDMDASDFPALIQNLEDMSQGIGLKEGYVPASTYWLVNESNRILGVANIRHRLAGILFKMGGHIGYGVRPSERRKGYAAEMLRLGLEIIKGMGIDRVLVTCTKSNIGSARTIMKNGGVFAEEELMNGEIEQRYWIELK